MQILYLANIYAHYFFSSVVIEANQVKFQLFMYYAMGGYVEKGICILVFIWKLCFCFTILGNTS